MYAIDVKTFLRILMQLIKIINYTEVSRYCTMKFDCITTSTNIYVKALCIFLTIFFLTGCGNDDPTEVLIPPKDEKIVILVSLDGFRFDYLNFTDTPGFDRIIENGVKADALVPVFPTKTFPNHYSQVTGLYPENHGIISNLMYDPEFEEVFTLSNEGPKEGKWFGGEPIWVTAEKQGVKTATYFWPGSEAEIEGFRPSYYEEFDGSVPYTTRTNQVLNWLSMPSQSRPRLITLYFQATDPEGHRYGPDKELLTPSIQEVDREITRLLNGIENMDLEEIANVLVFSDHGMAQLSRDSVIFLDDYISLNDFSWLNISPITDIYPAEGKMDTIFNQLNNAHPKFEVYKKEDIPTELHIANHPRVPPMIGIVANGWSVTTRDFFDNNPNAFTGGTHGYRPEHPDMWGIFMAVGPDFIKGASVDSFESIHLYELICRLLAIEPAPNDGSLSVTSEMLN